MLCGKGAEDRACEASVAGRTHGCWRWSLLRVATPLEAPQKLLRKQLTTSLRRRRQPWAAPPAACPPHRRLALRRAVARPREPGAGAAQQAMTPPVGSPRAAGLQAGPHPKKHISVTTTQTASCSTTVVLAAPYPARPTLTRVRPIVPSPAVRRRVMRCRAPCASRVVAGLP